MYKSFFKRVLDIFCSFLFLMIFFICFIIVGILIKFDDNGPIFYISYRRGKDGKAFKMYKFRSMKVNSEDIRNEDGSTYNSVNDDRQTRVGKIIRKLSIDEIPQIINVLIGDMSIVGPRPDMATRKYEQLNNEEKKRISVRPGITGYNQAYFRNSISMKEKCVNDCFYVDNITFFLDMKILFKTFTSVVAQKNINTN